MNCSSIMCKKIIDDDSEYCKFCGSKQSMARRQAAMQAAATSAPKKAAAGSGVEVIPMAPGELPPEPPRFEKEPVQPVAQRPKVKTPLSDFFIHAGTLRIYKGNDPIVVIPDTVTSIGAGVFKDHKNLRQIYIPEGIKDAEGKFIGCATIAKEAFAGCSALEKINLPYGMTSIGPSAFAGCTSLTGVHIPRTMEKILDKGFQNCSSITEIYIPDTTSTVSYYAFDGCTSLEKVRLPNGMKVLIEGTFMNCKSLTGLVLPEGLKSIEKHAFDSSGLVYITIPNYCIAIGEHAFSNIETLRGITVPKITKIDNSTFVNTNLINKGSIKYVMDSLD